MRYEPIDLQAKQRKRAAIKNSRRKRFKIIVDGQIHAIVQSTTREEAERIAREEFKFTTLKVKI